MTFNQPLTNFFIESYHPIIYKDNKTSQNKIPYQWDDVKPINLFTVIKARIYHPEIHVIGGIYNEKLGLNVPIAEGVNNSIYALCAGTLKPNQKFGEGNFTLAAHNVPTSKNALFTPLYKKAKIGDILYVTNFNKVYSYRIYAKSTISAYNQTIFQNSKFSKLTLITCSDSNNTKRIVFQAKLVNTKSYNDVSKSTRAFLDAKYTVRYSRWDMLCLNPWDSSFKEKNLINK